MDNYAKGEDIFMNRIKKLICVILGCVYLLFNLGIFMVIRTNLLPLSLVNLFVEAILNISLSTMLLFLLWYGSQKLLKIERKTFFGFLLSGTFLSWLGCVVCIFYLDAIAAIVGGVYLFCVIGMSVMICLSMIKKQICVIGGIIYFVCIERMYAVLLDEYGLFTPYVGKRTAICLICLLSLLLLLLFWLISYSILKIHTKKFLVNVILGGYLSLFFWPANNFFSAGADCKLKIEYLLFFLTISIIICCSIAGLGKLCKERE